MREIDHPELPFDWQVHLNMNLIQDYLLINKNLLRQVQKHR